MPVTQDIDRFLQAKSEPLTAADLERFIDQKEGESKQLGGYAIAPDLDIVDRDRPVFPRKFDPETPSATRSAVDAFLQSAAQVATSIPKSVGALGEAAKSFLVPAMMGADSQEEVESMKSVGGPEPDVRSNPLYRLGAAIDEELEQDLPTNPKLRGSFLWDVLPRGAGTLLMFMAPGSGAGAVGLGAATGGASQLDAALQSGATDTSALKAAGLGGIIGTTDALPVQRAFRVLDRVTGGKVTSGLRLIASQAFKGGITEATQELGQAIADNAVARRYYDEDRELKDGVTKAAGAGGILGAIASAIVAGVAGRKLKTRGSDITLEKAKSFIKDNPERAQQLSLIAKPSRDDLPGIDTAGDRARFAALVRSQMKELTVVPESERGPLTLATPAQETINEGQLQEQGQQGQVIEGQGPQGPGQEGQEQAVLGAAKARKEFGDALDEFGRYLQGRTFTGAPFDPEIYRLAGNIVSKGINAGVRTFAEFVREVAQRIGPGRARRLLPALKREWGNAASVSADLDQPGDVEAVLASIPEPEKPAIRTDLANPAIGTPGAEVVESVDAARNLAGVPDVQSDIDVQSQAAQLQPEEAKRRLLRAVEAGRDLTPVETVAAKELVRQEANAAIVSGDEQALVGAMTTINAYRQTGTEQGRSFRQRQNLGETDEQHRERMLHEAILTPPESVEPKTWAEQLMQFKAELRRLGIDLSDIPGIAANPTLAAQVLGQIHALKASKADKAFEYWRNAILSSPLTQAANLAGNTLNAAWDMTAQRMVEASLNLFTQRPEGARFGEFPQMLRGMLPGISRGARNFLSSWRSEIPTFDVQSGQPMTTRFETPNVAIRGKKGRAIRTPQRVLLAVDEFAKSMIWEMQVGAQAYRIGKSEGLSGNALANRMEELVSDVHSEASEKAYQDALRLTFQDHTGRLLNAVLAARKDIPGLRYLVPFVTTPVNIFRTGLRKSPLGAAPLGVRILKAVKSGKWDGLTPYMAEQIIAWAVLAALLANDPSDPWITGSASSLDRRTRELAQRRGAAPPQSIKIGNTWVSYARIEPFATTIALVVDMLDGWKKGSTEGAAKGASESLLGQLDDKTFLRGMGDIMNAVREHSVESVAQWASNFAVSWVPNIVRATGRATQSDVPERGVWGRGEEWRERFGRRLAQKTEMGLVADQPKYDIWGRTVQYNIGPTPGTDWLYRMLVPMNLKMSEPFPGDVAILNWNNKHPDDEYYPVTPRKLITKRGKNYYMTDGEFTAYSKLAGELARKPVERYFESRDPFNPTPQDMKFIAARISDARETARKRLRLGMKGPAPTRY